jgi:hypothetical protein
LASYYNCSNLARAWIRRHFWASIFTGAGEGSYFGISGLIKGSNPREDKFDVVKIFKVSEDTNFYDLFAGIAKKKYENIKNFKIPKGTCIIIRYLLTMNGIDSVTSVKILANLNQIPAVK